MGARTVEAVSSLVVHFWSLSIEEQFYLCWPAVVQRVKPRALLTLCGVLALSSLLARILLHRWNMPDAAYTSTVCRCDGLAIGAAIALAARNRSLWAVFSRFAPLTGAVSLTSLALSVFVRKSAEPGDPWIATAGISLVSALFRSVLVLMLNTRRSTVSRLLDSGPLAFLGKYSYSIYIFHQLILVGSEGTRDGRIRARHIDSRSVTA